jgi:outer membrane lipoprotein-sorting protein
MILLKVALLLLFTVPNGYADEILTRISARVAKVTITKGEFLQEKRLKYLTKPLITKGSFIYQQNRGVLWKTLTPLVSTLLINDSQILTEEGGQAIPPAFGGVFNILLSGELLNLAENFDMTGTDNGKSWQLKLVPKDELMKKIIAVIRVEGDQDIRVWELQETGGNLTRINFSQITHPDYLNKEQIADFERLSH